ncbi:MAG: glucose-6-phosphate dehydrogenase, partial [Opitutae bacterium]|nr:glucose-6-phosphate dehydrogenase [Opitutae bacterium]
MTNFGKRSIPPTVMVIFGASGDLTSRKLVPALFNLSVDGLLPEHFYLIGYGRKAVQEDQFRSSLKESLGSYSRREIKDDVWSKLEPNISFHSGAYDDASSFDRLKTEIEEIEKSVGAPVQSIFYLSTPPSGFLPILENLGNSGLARMHHNTRSASKVIVEKPFGRDLESARELNQVINRRFAESQVFRIDHYLGKETVQSLLVQRFANTIFEPVWNRNYVSSVQITVSEDLGVGSRAGYYDRSGALRDMIQNHVMQLLALTAMEPPSSLDPEAIRDEKVKALQAIKPLILDNSHSEVVRGVYTEGLVGGEKAVGYLEEEGVPSTSFTETYTALSLQLDNWRWKGV